MTLLSVCQNASRAVGFNAPTSIIGSSDPFALQLGRFANLTGKALSKMGRWPILNKEYTFPTVNGQAEYDFPTDFDYDLADTDWNRSQRWPIRGPLTPQEWQVYKSGFIGNGLVHQRYRIKRAASGVLNKFVVDPTPTVADTLVFEYLSKNWVRNTGSTDTFDEYTADTDVALLDEYLIELGVIWRIKKEKGLPYAADEKEYEDMTEKARARAGTAPTISIGKRFSNGLIGPENIPDTGFGV